MHRGRRSRTDRRAATHATSGTPMATWEPRANELFLRAADVTDPADRAALLERECAGKAGLLSAEGALWHQPSMAEPIGLGSFVAMAGAK